MWEQQGRAVIFTSSAEMLPQQVMGALCLVLLGPGESSPEIRAP